MSETSNNKRQIRITQTNYEALVSIQQSLGESFSLAAIGNFAMGRGMESTRQALGVKPEKAKKTKC